MFLDHIGSFDRLVKLYDSFHFKRILHMQSNTKKVFYDAGGCGLEIEFGVEYDRRCRAYIENGLRKIKKVVGPHGRFVPDVTVGRFLNVEIALLPFERDRLQPLFEDIADVIRLNENFIFDEHCGVHANFRADEAVKREFYLLLLNGRYQSERFSHNKYKLDFTAAARKNDGRLRTYEEYLNFQHNVVGKYCSVNFLKEHLLEVRALNLDWQDVVFFMDLYEEALIRAGQSMAVLEANPESSSDPSFDLRGV